VTTNVPPTGASRKLEKEKKMNIISIESKHMTKNSFAGLCEIEGGFRDYFTIIHYTDPREGERAERVYNVCGHGDTEYQSEQDALENLKAEMAARIYAAYEKFLVANGAGMLEIA